MSVSRSNNPNDGAAAREGRLSRLSKKLKKRQPPELTDLPYDSPPVECPPPYQCYVNMKPFRKRRFNIAKRFLAKVNKGIMHLTSERNAKVPNDGLASEYNIDLAKVSILYEDQRKRFIIKYKVEAHQLTPINKDDYETYKSFIHRHRLYRQGFLRNNKDESTSEVAVSLYGVRNSLPAASASNSREVLLNDSRFRDATSPVDLIDKIVWMSSEIKTLSTTIRQMHKDIKEIINCLGIKGKIPTIGIKESTQESDKQKDSEDESESESDETDENYSAATGKVSVLALAVPKKSPEKENHLKDKNKELKDAKPSTPKINATKPEKKIPSPAPRIGVKRKASALIDSNETKSDIVSASLSEEVVPKKKREQLPKYAVPGEELGLRTMMAIAAKRANIPISFFEPLTMLQVMCEQLRYASMTLSKASLSNDPVERIAYVAAFAVSGYSGMNRRRQKPFNPLLGETYDYISNDGWRYHAEQVAHHPAVSAAHADGDGWTWWETFISTPKTSWTGTVEATPELPVRLSFGKEDYSWNKARVIVENAASAPECRKLRVDGTMYIRCNNGLTSTITFRKDKDTEVTGCILDTRGILVAKLNGFWDRYLQKNQKEYLFEAIPLPKNADKYYGFTQFTAGLNELLPEQKLKLPLTDSRLRPDVRALENADTVMATSVKVTLEKAQRARNPAMHTILWFEQKQDSMTNTTLWISNGRYWQAKAIGFKNCPNMLQLFKYTP